MDAGPGGRRAGGGKVNPGPGPGSQSWATCAFQKWGHFLETLNKSFPILHAFEVEESLGHRFFFNTLLGQAHAKKTRKSDFSSYFHYLLTCFLHISNRIFFFLQRKNINCSSYRRKWEREV